MDDSTDMRRYIGRRLRGSCRVLEAADGLDALAVLEHERVDLVIAAAVMPRMDGYTLCRALHADPGSGIAEAQRSSPVPVLLVSSELDPDADLPSGCGFLLKPFNAQGLQSSVAGLLGRP